MTSQNDLLTGRLAEYLNLRREKLLEGDLVPSDTKARIQQRDRLRTRLKWRTDPDFRKTKVATVRKNRARWRRTEEGRWKIYLSHVRKTWGEVGVQFIEDKAHTTGYHCDACGFVPDVMSKNRSMRFLRIDHDHDTGEIRGLLCNRCNLAEGHFKNDPDSLEGLLNYIKGNTAGGYGLPFDSSEQVV